MAQIMDYLVPWSDFEKASHRYGDEGIPYYVLEASSNPNFRPRERFVASSLKKAKAQGNKYPYAAIDRLVDGAVTGGWRRTPKTPEWWFSGGYEPDERESNPARRAHSRNFATCKECERLTRQFEREGMSTSDAQAAAEAEHMKAGAVRAQKGPESMSAKMKPSKVDLSRVKHYYLNGVIAANNGDARNPHPPRSLAAFAWSKGNADKRMSPRSIWDAYYDDSGVPRSRNPSRKSIHTAKFDRCVESVKRSGSDVNPYAVCSSAIGEEGSVRKGHRRRNPAGYPFILSKNGMVQVYSDAGQELPYTWTGIVQDGNASSHVKFWYLGRENGERSFNALHAKTYDEAKTEARRFMKRGRNPLPAVRKLYYIICAHKGVENYYLARSGKLTRSQSSAARFPTAAAAIDKAKAHLKNYAASRKYRFDLKLAY